MAMGGMRLMGCGLGLCVADAVDTGRRDEQGFGRGPMALTPAAGLCLARVYL